MVSRTASPRPGRSGWAVGGIVGGAGDSGAPVYIERTDGTVGARGICVSGRLGYELPCAVMRYEPPDGAVGNECDSEANVVDIQAIKAHWQVQIELGL